MGRIPGGTLGALFRVPGADDRKRRVAEKRADGAGSADLREELGSSAADPEIKTDPDGLDGEGFVCML